MLVLILGYGIYSIVSSAGSISTDFGLGSDQTVIYEEESYTDQIAVIPVSGVIMEDDSSGLGSSTVATASTIINALDEARDDEAVKAIILSVNSPGGAVVPSDLIYQKVKAVNEDKPVIAFFNDVAASGGYYISAGTSGIVAHPETLTGSIGVIMSLSNIEGLYEKLGIQDVVIKSGSKKDIGSSTRKMADEERALLQQIIDESFETFLTLVKTHRNLTPEQVATIEDGRVVSGKMALQLGLVDKLGLLGDAIAMAKEKAHLEKVQVINYQQEKGLLRTILDMQSKPNFSLSLSPSITKQLPAGMFYLWDMQQ